MNQWGGYRLHRPDDDGPATLTLNGEPVGLVHLAADGGHHRYEFTDPQAERAYTVLAEDLSPDALEPDDVLTDKLAVVDDLDRSPSVVFVIDEDDFFTTGRYRTYGPNVGLDHVVAMLTGAHRPGGDVIPKVWVTGDGFVPVDELGAGSRLSHLPTDRSMSCATSSRPCATGMSSRSTGAGMWVAQ